MAATPVPHDSNKDVFRGQLFLFIGDQPIAFASSASLNITTEEVDVSNKMMGNWAASMPGKKSFSVSSESLITYKEGELSIQTLLGKQIADETLDFFIGQVIETEPTNVGGKFEKDTTKPNYTGTVMITSIDVKSDNGSIATCSVSLKGVGALVPSDGVTPPPTIKNK